MHRSQQSSQWRVAFAVLAFATLFGAGCGGSEADGGESDADADSDADTDADSDSDSDDDVVRWRVVYDESDLSAWVISAWGPSPDLVYFVGGTADSSLVIRWDGTSFERVDLDLEARLWWACGTGPDDVWVVGERGASAYWDGETWTELPRLEGNPTLWGCWPTGNGDVLAVGERNLGVGETDPVSLRVERSTGAGAPWALLEAPEHAPVNLFKVWGAAPDDAWIVGEFGAMLHWDGKALSEIELESDYRMVTVTGRSATEIYIAGGGSALCGNGTFLSREGDGWTAIKDGCDGEDEAPWPALNGVSVDPDGTVFVAGITGFLAQGSPDAMQVQEAITERDLHAVWAADVDDVWAMGGNMQTTAGDPVGVILHYGPAVEANPL